MTSDKRHGRGTPGAAPTQASVVEKVAEKINSKADKLDRKLDRIAAKATAKADGLDRISAKVARHAETLDRIGSGLGALDLWTRAEPSSRRPRFTRDDITATAMRIADSDGFDALSMRRLAAELDAGTMTLYHYVRTKDELLTLVIDAVMGEVVLGPDEPMPAGWRDAVTLIAEKTRAAILRHPWFLEITDDPAIGPNSVRHFDQSLQAVASLPISLVDKFDIVSAVDEYTFGSCIWERDGGQRDKPGDDMVSYVNGLVETGHYPELAALTAEHGLAEAWEQIERHQRDPERFARNLRRLLDGIEADLPADRS
jgi:AcrR family transcriptional regulator